MSLQCQGWPRLGPRPETVEELRAREEAVTMVVTRLKGLMDSLSVSEDGCTDN